MNDLGQIALYRQKRPSGQLSLWPLRRAHPRLVRVHASSGTTGKPITGPYTADDLEQWTDCMARNLIGGRGRSNDIIQNAYGYGIVHRRTRLPPGSHQNRGHGSPHLFRPDRTADHHHAGFWDHRSFLHPFLRLDHCRKSRIKWVLILRSLPSTGRGLRSGTLDQGNAQGNRRTDGYQSP